MKNIFTRSKRNPILKPNTRIPWESVMVYNPGVIFEKEKYHLFYRAIGKAWVSKIGHAVSDDGETFTKKTHPVFKPEQNIEKNGTEDPRITKIKDTYYMTYTAYDGKCARLALATSSDLDKWKKHGLIFPDWDAKKAFSFRVDWDKYQFSKEAKTGWNKAGAIIPEIINNKYWMLFGDRNIWTASSKNGKTWKANYKPFLKPRKGCFDSVHIEMGPPPIKTEKGWLAIYHGIDEKRTYRLGFALLNLFNPRKIIHRTSKPIFEPQKPYEISGLVDLLPGGFGAMEKMDEKKLKKYVKTAIKNHAMPRVIFCTGAVLKNNKLKIYYGAGDSVICMAETNINKLI